MIKYSTGDIFSSQAEALVNPVNCVGVMGKGLALKFKQIYPENFKAYHRACHDGEVRPGRMHVTFPDGVPLPRVIINFPTKRRWNEKSRMEDINAGLVDLVRVVRAERIRSIAIPALGCGLGGLDWNTVRSRIENAFTHAGLIESVDVMLFPPK